MIFPLFAMLTPTLSSPSVFVRGSLPTANMTVSNSSLRVSPFCVVKVTLSFPVSSFSILSGTPLTILVPPSTMCVTMNSAICWSKPLRGMERIMTVVSEPRWVRKPAHSSATYEAPTTRVLPGAFSRKNTSSEVIPYSLAPGISGYRGRPPTAITTFSAVIVFVSLRLFVFLSKYLHSTV
eukprot:Lithocolla_globosa_v1_NODE_3019_length_1790_cov_311.439263.p3 type:complete len:180 gc:universal NODE_3019_length_1790_cov_311.439263:754-1293(+)